MTVGSVLEQSLALYQRFFWRFVATTAVVMVFLDLSHRARGDRRLHAAARRSGRSSASSVGLVGTFCVQGALTFAVDDVRDGRIDTTIGELYRAHAAAPRRADRRRRPRRARDRDRPLLLIAPGLYLLTRWALIVPGDRARGRRAPARRSRARPSSPRGTAGPCSASPSSSSSRASSSAASPVAILVAILPTFLGAWLGSLVAHCIDDAVPRARVDGHVLRARALGRARAASPRRPRPERLRAYSAPVASSTRRPRSGSTSRVSEEAERETRLTPARGGRADADPRPRARQPQAPRR